MAKFIIPQIKVEEEKKQEEKVPEKKETKKEGFVSSFFGTNVRDEISVMGAHYGNSGLQYDTFRDKEKRLRDDSADYVAYKDDRTVSARADLSDEDRRRPSYLNLDPAYADVYGRTRQEEKKEPVMEQQVQRDYSDRPSQRDYLDRPSLRTPGPIIGEYIEEENSIEENESFEEESFTRDEEYVAPVKAEPEEVKTVKITRKEKYFAPPFSLLQHGQYNKTNGDDIAFQENAINETLQEFRIGAHVVTHTKGPAVTQFEVAVDPGVKIESVRNIQNNIQAKCCAQSIRIQTPIPGKSTVGIEIPNVQSDVVYFGDLVDNNEFLNDGKPLNVVIGLDLFGKPLYFDLAKAPHALIGGTTGSGKSVCINCIINSIIYKDHPDDVKMILVDPKILEFSVYNNIPHLAMPVLTESKDSAAALQWCCNEMDNRYRMMSPFGCRDIKEFNELARQRPDLKHLPYIVIIIDELADLIATSGSQVSECIQRITQKGRSAGIHMILATQRPSVDIINGTIKTNASVRIAFKVSASVDSNVILDHQGAEKLLGHGDMLFNDSVNEMRAQGALIESKEINAICDYLAQRSSPDFLTDLQDEINEQERKESVGIDDDEFREIAEWVVLNDCASCNRIQQEFHISFNKAKMIMDTLGELGVVSENLGTTKRNVIMQYSEVCELLDRVGSK